MIFMINRQLPSSSNENEPSLERKVVRQWAWWDWGIAITLLFGAIQFFNVDANSLNETNWLPWYAGGVSVLVAGCAILLGKQRSRIARQKKEQEALEAEIENNLDYQSRLIDSFKHTHTTWHTYKRMFDDYTDGSYDSWQDVMFKAHTDVINTMIAFRKCMENLTGHNLMVSLKGIQYQADVVNSLDYAKCDFILSDMTHFRDPSEPASFKNDIVTGLEFFKSTQEFRETLSHTLFYKCFCKKAVVFTNKFDEVQGELTSKYKSGLVAPLIILDIPLFMVCLGGTGEGAFLDDYHELVATFADALAEKVRLYEVLRHAGHEKKLYITDKNALEKLIKRLEEPD